MPIDRGTRSDGYCKHTSNPTREAQEGISSTSSKGTNVYFGHEELVDRCHSHRHMGRVVSALSSMPCVSPTEVKRSEKVAIVLTRRILRLRVLLV